MMPFAKMGGSLNEIFHLYCIILSHLLSLGLFYDYQFRVLLFVALGLLSEKMAKSCPLQG